MSAVDGEFDDTEGEELERKLAMGLGGIEEEETWETEGAGAAGGSSGKRLVDVSLPARYLAAQCQVSPDRPRRSPFRADTERQVRMGLWDAALELLGPSNPFQGSGQALGRPSRVHW